MTPALTPDLASHPIAIAIITGYLACALLLAVGALILAALLRWCWALAGRAPERWLAVGWTLLVLALTLPWAGRAMGLARTARAPLEIWSGPRIDARHAPRARVTFVWDHARSSVHSLGLPLAPQALTLVVALWAGGVGSGLARLCARRRRLGRLCAAMPVIKQLGQVRVCASDQAPTPFAACDRGTTYIVIPTSLLAEPERLRLVIAHEAHHHRRGDLHAAALLGLVRLLFFWNPLLALWERAIADLQDFACDRRVLRRPCASALAYGHVLVWAAEFARQSRPWSGMTRGMAGGSAASLTRRIVMLNDRPFRGQRLASWIFAAAAGALMLGSSWLVLGAVQDHRVTRAQVEGLAAGIERRTGFPVVVDDRVVARLNHWVADPGARALMLHAMARMPTYRPMIEQTLRARGLPPELLGMVMAESAFDNQAHPDTPLEERSAGIWQLIPRTGRQLGLAVSSPGVSPESDERLDPLKATDAAARLLAQLFDRYGDWPVAIAAYNAGQEQVDALTAAAASRTDARSRVLAGDEEHARYLRAVMASVILIENPALLD